MRLIDNVIKKIEDRFEEPFLAGNLKQFLIGPSKRIRSHLVLLYLQACNVEITESVYAVLAAGEIIHTSSLLHDDVLDDAEYRRGEKTIGSEYGSKLSILGGDYLLAYAMEKLLEVSNIKVFEIFKDCTKKMIQGEFKQYYLRGTLPTFDEYLEICKLKTASLFVAIAESSNIVLAIENFEFIRFAELFGVYFQIMNDLEQDSAKQDKKNQIYTAVDILGIEKTKALLDNYREEMGKIVANLPESVYKKDLGDLFKQC